MKKQLSESEDQIRIIQIQVEGIEVEAAKKIKELIHCKEITKKKDSEIDTLKHVIKNNKSDFDTLNADLKKVKKDTKFLEKNVYNLENVKLNQQDKSKALKEEKNKLKTEKMGLEKKLKTV